MPRVILRTVEPAKLLACQSVEKRCTRMKASRDTSDMIFSVNGTIACRPISRRIIDSSAERHDAAEGDQRGVPRRRIRRAQRQRIDQPAGEQRHEQVGRGRAQQAAGDDQRRGAGCSSQWRNTNGITTRIAAGRLSDLSGHGLIRLRSRARRLHLNGRADGHEAERKRR